MFQFQSRIQRPFPKPEWGFNQFLIVGVLVAGLLTLIPFLSIGYSKLFGWNPITSFAVLVSLATLLAVIRKGFRQRNEALRSALTETRTVSVDESGIRRSSGDLSSTIGWEDIEHVALSQRSIVFQCRREKTLEFRNTEIGSKDSSLALLEYSRAQIARYGTQPPSYFRFVVEIGEERPHATVVVDTGGFRILDGNFTVEIPWREIRGLSEEDAIFLLEFQKHPPFAFAKGPFGSDETRQAFIAFVERSIAQFRLH